MKVMVCVNGAKICGFVRDYGIYVAKILNLEVCFFSIIENQEIGNSFYGLAAGGIVLGEKDIILSNYANLEEQNSEDGVKKIENFLNECVKTAQNEGVKASKILRNGDFIDTINEFKDESAIFVTAARYDESDDIDFNANMLIKELKIPVLLVNKEFSPIKSVLLAFDGTLASVKIAEFIKNSPFFENVKKFIINIGTDAEKSNEALNVAKWLIGEKNAEYIHINSNEIGEEIIKFRRANELDLIATGAFSKNFFKKMLVGSVSQNIIQNALVPILVIA